MDIATLRAEMDRLNRELLALFVQRMRTAQEIGAYKKARDLPVYDPQREAEVIQVMTKASPEDLAAYVGPFFQCLMDLAKEAEHKTD